jgi:hypothetical protein
VWRLGVKPKLKGDSRKAVVIAMCNNLLREIAGSIEKLPKRKAMCTVMSKVTKGGLPKPLVPTSTTMCPRCQTQNISI